MKKFKMKGINTLMNSPLLQTNGKVVKNTKFTTTRDGEKIPVGREITTSGEREVEERASDDQAYLDSFTPEFTRAKQEGFTGDLAQYILNKNEELGYTGSKINQVRDYTMGLITKDGEEFKNRYFKKGSKGSEDEAFTTGEFLAGLINTGGGEGDPGNYITSNEAIELYKKYNKQIVRPNQPKPTDPNNFTSIRNWNNWRKQRGLEPSTVSYQKGYKPKSYLDNDNLTNWRNVNDN